MVYYTLRGKAAVPNTGLTNRLIAGFVDDEVDSNFNGHCKWRILDEVDWENRVTFIARGVSGACRLRCPSWYYRRCIMFASGGAHHQLHIMNVDPSAKVHDREPGNGSSMRGECRVRLEITKATPRGKNLVGDIGSTFLVELL